MGRRPFSLPADVRAYLWEGSQAQVAARAQVSITVVQRWREETLHPEPLSGARSAPRKYSPTAYRSYPAEPPPEVLDLLGKLADSRISTETGIPTHIVRRWRIALNLPPGGWINFTLDPKASYEARYPGVLELLETCPLKDVARHFGVSTVTLAKVRKALGLPKLPRGTAKLSDENRNSRLEKRYPGLLSRLGIVSDGVLAAEYEITRSYLQLIRARLGIASFTEHRREDVVSDPSFGKETDLVLAAQYGLASQTVGKWRRDKGVPPSTDRGKVVEDFTPYLGKISDHKIATSFDVPIAFVQRARDKFGIPPLRRSPASPGFVAINQTQMMQMFEAGRSNIEIADFFGANPQYIGTLLNRQGVYRHGRRRSSTRASPCPKIDRDLVRKLLDEHKTYAEIAEVLGCASTTIGEIARKEFGVERGTNAFRKRREAQK